MKKFAMIMAVLLALGLAAPCFAEGNVVTKWSVTGPGGTGYITFYDDGTAEITFDDEVTVVAYIGDTKKNGTITLSAGGKETLDIEVRGDRLFAFDVVFTKMK